MLGGRSAAFRIRQKRGTAYADYRLSSIGGENVSYMNLMLLTKQGEFDFTEVKTNRIPDWSHFIIDGVNRSVYSGTRCDRPMYWFFKCDENWLSYEGNENHLVLIPEEKVNNFRELVSTAEKKMSSLNLKHACVRYFNYIDGDEDTYMDYTAGKISEKDYEEAEGYNVQGVLTK